MDLRQNVAPIYIQQPCHADMGMCDGGQLWLRIALPCNHLIHYSPLFACRPT